MITQINLNGIDLRKWPYQFYIGGNEDINKDVVTNDLFGDGQSWGRSKNGIKTIIISGYIKSFDKSYRIALNKAIAPNGLKLLMLTETDGSRKIAQVEIQSRAATENNPRKISITCVMPDPHWYAVDPSSIQLGAQYSTGVVFGPRAGVSWKAKNLLKLAVGSLTGVGSAAATQYIINGNFAVDSNSDGLADGFTLANASSVSCVRNLQTFIVISQYGYIRSSFIPSAGHRYFICANICADSSLVTLGMRSSGPIYNNFYHQGDGKYHIVSGIVDVASGFNDGFAYVGDNRGSGRTNISIMGMMAIDMGTDSGNPFYKIAADQMLKMVQKKGYFEGSSQLGGVDVTVAPDGTITVDGVVVSSKDVTFLGLLSVAYPVAGDPTQFLLIPGNAYTFSITNVSGSYNGTWQLNACKGQSGLFTLGSYLSYTSVSYTAVLGDVISNVGLWFAQGTTASSWVFRIQLEQGSAPTVWRPWGYSETGVIFGMATGETGTIINAGNADAYPIITIVGACSGPTVTNQTTGESVSIEMSLTDSDTLVIDCRPDTCGVYLNGVSNIGLKQGAGWIHCPPGDNIFTFSRNSLESKKHCTVSLQSRWV